MSAAEGKSMSEELEQFFDLVWFDPDKRPKTAFAMQHLLKREPTVFDEVFVTVFAPDPTANGQSWLLSQPLSPRRIIYLAPHIETESQEEVDFIVAHEFAHAYLKHAHTIEGTAEDAAQFEERCEREADALVKKWGFVIPVRRVLPSFGRNFQASLDSKKVLRKPNPADAVESGLRDIAATRGKDLETVKDELMDLQKVVKYRLDPLALQVYQEHITKQRAKK